MSQDVLVAYEMNVAAALPMLNGLPGPARRAGLVSRPTG